MKNYEIEFKNRYDLIYYPLKFRVDFSKKLIF